MSDNYFRHGRNAKASGQKPHRHGADFAASAAGANHAVRQSVSRHPEAVQPACQGESAEGERAEGAGLVHISTSDTVPCHSHDLRLSRMKRSVITTARLHQEELQSGSFRHRVAMLTLTYAPGQEWAAYQITALLKLIRVWLGRRNHRFRYVWVMELQARGAPHYHVLVWLPKGLSLPKPDKQGWWPYGLTRIEYARNAVSYIAKYASKIDQKGGGIPKGARIHGGGGLTSAGRLQRTWWLLPSYIRDVWSAELKPRRAKGGGWFNQLGEWLPSLWVLDWGQTRFPFVVLRRVGMVPEGA